MLIPLNELPINWRSGYAGPMNARQNVSSGTEWEPFVGYSRAVRVDNRIVVSGATATLKDGSIACPGDAYGQTVQVIRNIERTLTALDARLDHVVRTRMFVTDIARWKEYGRAHGEFSGDIRPAASMLEVSRLIDPRMLIEIEVDAIA